MAAKFCCVRAWKTLFRSRSCLTGTTPNTQFVRQMSSDQSQGERQEVSPLDKLRAFGYAFDEAGKLKQLNADGDMTAERFVFNKTDNQNLNQKHYEDLGEIITEVVYELLDKEGLTRSYFPADVPKEEASFVFTKPSTLDKSSKLLVLIHGSGVVRAGQWARSLIINQSLDHGTMIPYVKRAVELGYDILITNTNDKHRVVNGKQVKVKGTESASQHAILAWQQYVMATGAQSVAIVAHSMGGYISMELANQFPKFFKERFFGVALTDSVHTDAYLQGEIREYVAKIGCNWISSKKPLDEPIDNSSESIIAISAGHHVHEWTSYTAMDSVFKFLTDRYEVFVEEKSQTLDTKRPKLA